MALPTIEQLLSTLEGMPDCKVLPPAGLPTVRNGLHLPRDLAEFYRLCGGCTLFAKAEYPSTISPPSRVRPSNDEIIEEEAPDDISHHWYVIARARSGETFSIDLARRRHGRCYDTFWDTYGQPGETPIIALSFRELLTGLVIGQGERWYWKLDAFEPLGDAYDEL